MLSEITLQGCRSVLTPRNSIHCFIYENQTSCACVGAFTSDSKVIEVGLIIDTAEYLNLYIQNETAFTDGLGTTAPCSINVDTEP